MRRLERRQLLGLAALAGVGIPERARAETASRAAADARFDVADWRLEGAPELARRAVVLVPRGLATDERLPVLVLLHGLGETTDEGAGVRAWIDRYGLTTAHARLARPPIGPEGRRGDLRPERARAINDALLERPFDGRAIYVCPFTPNVWRLPQLERGLDSYAGWIADVLLPEVRAKLPARSEPRHTGIDGCSLGGFVGLEVFLRRPEVFGAWGGVQSALREANAGARAARVAAAIEAHGARRIHVETSLGDPFCRANQALSRELTKRGVVNELLVLPGPHDQPWLREVGTIEMLRWHDRALRG